MKIVVCKQCGREHILVSGEKYERCERCGAEPKGKKNLLFGSLIAAGAIALAAVVILLVYTFTVKNITVDDIRYKKTGDYYTVVGYHSDIGAEVQIPETVKGVKVGAIGDEAFFGSSITSVVIPEGVKLIGVKAFANCDLLETVKMPSTLEKISEHAFFHCDSLKGVVFPSSIKKIGNSAFYSCKSLSSIKIPASVTELGMSVFARCYGLVDVTVENGIKEIPYALLEDCNKLVNITLPVSVTKIGEKAFYRAGRLENVTILGKIIVKNGENDQVFGIGASAFDGCMNLKNINYGGSENEWLNINKGSHWDRESGAYSLNFDYAE